MIPPAVPSYAEHVHHLYTVRVPRRDGLSQYLQERGIGTGIHYPIPCHLQPSFLHLGDGVGDLLVKEHLAGEILSLPMCPKRATEQRLYLASAIREFYEK